MVLGATSTRLFLACLLLVTTFIPSGRAQSLNASLSGTVTDPSGSVIPNAELVLTSLTTGSVVKTTTRSEGLFTFQNLPADAYDLKVSAGGFRDFLQRGIVIRVNEKLRVDVKLELGTAEQAIEVSANASPLNFDNAEVKQGITPESIQELPLLVSGSVRSAASFIILMPGVTTGGQGSAFDAHINGGMSYAGEAVLDGVGVVQSYGGGVVGAIVDTPWSPESIGEVSVLTSNFEPQYGASSSGVVTAVTKSGTNEFHGTLFEFHRNTVLNARQFGIPERPRDIENDFGGNFGGPVPKLGKTYFFVNFEEFRQAGGLTSPVLSIPSLKERQGDFSDWVDSDGNLIPVYDPATTRANSAFDPNLPVGLTNLPISATSSWDATATPPM
jgi:Carboxypeptidase regulatory-like domain